MSEQNRNARAGIYQIRCLANGKIYVGSATNIKKRWQYHRGDLVKGKHPNPHLQSAWRKYGAGSFVWEVLQYIADEAALISAEQSWLDRTRAFDREIGFNISPTAASSFGIKRSEESRAKMSAAKKGRKRSPETIAKIAAANKGKKMPPEAVARVAAANRGKKRTPEQVAKVVAALRGRKRSPEMIAKIAEAHRGLKRSAETKSRMSESANRRFSDIAECEKISRGKARANREAKRKIGPLECQTLFDFDGGQSEDY